MAEKDSYKGLLTIFALLLFGVLILLGGGVYFLYETSLAIKTENQSINTENQSIINLTEAIKTQTASLEKLKTIFSTPRQVETKVIYCSELVESDLVVESRIKHLNPNPTFIPNPFSIPSPTPLPIEPKYGNDWHVVATLSWAYPGNEYDFSASSEKCIIERDINP